MRFGCGVMQKNSQRLCTFSQHVSLQRIQPKPRSPRWVIDNEVCERSLLSSLGYKLVAIKALAAKSIDVADSL